MNTQGRRKSEGNDKRMLKNGFDTNDNRKGALSVTEVDVSDNQQQDNLLIDSVFGNSDIPDLQHLENITDLLDNQPQSKKNIRVATRFIREDIAASIKAPGILSFAKTIPVNLMDIASRGVLISTSQQLGINKKITLTLQFKSGKVFVIKGRVVRRSDSSRNEYGIKFDCYNNELGDYLLETQGKLIFK